MRPNRIKSNKCRPSRFLRRGFVAGLTILLIGQFLAVAVAATGLTDEEENKKKAARAQQQRQLEEEAYEQAVPQEPMPQPALPTPPKAAAPQGVPSMVPGAPQQQMPVPPGYAPGTPGYQQMPQPPAGAAAYPGMPTPPTGYGAVPGAAPGYPGQQQGGYGAPAAGYPAYPAGQAAGTMQGGSVPMAQPGSAGLTTPPPVPTPMPDPYQFPGTDPRFSQPAAVSPQVPIQSSPFQSGPLQGKKPFSDYKTPDPSSVYENLGNPVDLSRGTNTYYETVQPRLQQKQQNRRVNQNIRGLQAQTQRPAQTGGIGDRSEIIRQRPGNLPVQATPHAPATFMNTGSFFPPPSNARR